MNLISYISIKALPIFPMSSEVKIFDSVKKFRKGPIALMIFPSRLFDGNFNSSYQNSNTMIATIFGAWHDSHLAMRSQGSFCICALPIRDNVTL